MRKMQLPLAVIVAALWIGCGGHAAGQCNEEPPLQNFTGGGQVVCPCFVTGEEAGAVLTAPSGHYPIQILRVGIGWGSQFGGAPQSLETAINIYEGGLPNPGTPIESMLGPVLTDGAINEFDLEPLPGDIIINSGPFTATLEFLNNNAGDPFAPSMVHDGNGCQSTKNVVFAMPGAWYDACVLGVTGDWVVHVVYCWEDLTGVRHEEIVSSGLPSVPTIHQNYPNPFNPATTIGFDLPVAQSVRLTVMDASGRTIATLADGLLAAGPHEVLWNGRDGAGRPQASGIYFYRVDFGSRSETRSMLLLK